MHDLLFPSTDAGVVAQLGIVAVGSIVVLWGLRKRPDARLFAFGLGVTLVALIGVRALH